MANPYGADHQRRVAHLKQTLVPGTPCRRCGLPMYPWQDLDGGHDVEVLWNPASRADALEHAHCNRSAGGQVGNRIKQLNPSRKW